MAETIPEVNTNDINTTVPTGLINFFFATSATTPGFNSLIPAPRVPSLVSTEPVELLCRCRQWQY